METFYSQAECEQRLEEALTSDRLPARLGQAIAGALTKELYEPPSAVNADGLELKVGRWVVRGEDLDVFDVIKAGALLPLSADGSIAPASIALGVSIARVVWKCYRRGATLGGDTLTVFTELRRGNGAHTAQGIAEALGAGWSAERARAALTTLTAIPTKSGTVELAKQMPNGEWLAVD